MSGDYPPDLIRAWIIQFGSIERAEEEARTRPGFGDEIRKIESQQSALLNLADLGGDSGRELEERRRRLVVAALTEDKEDGARQEPSLTRLPPLPPDVNLFQFSSIQKAARLFEDGASINAVADRTVFDRHDASRLQWMIQREFFRLSNRRLLPPDWRVGRGGRKYALRFFDEAAGKWIDPETARAANRTPG